MIPIDFKEANLTLTKPDSMTDKECSSLRVWKGNGELISCWKPSWKERFSIFFFGVVWLSVLSETTQPPVAVWAYKTLFKKK